MRSGYLKKKIDDEVYINILDLNEQFVLFNFSNGRKEHRAEICDSGEGSYFEYNNIKYYIKDFERGDDDGLQY